MKLLLIILSMFSFSLYAGCQDIDHNEFLIERTIELVRNKSVFGNKAKVFNTVITSDFDNELDSVVYDAYKRNGKLTRGNVVFSYNDCSIIMNSTPAEIEN